MQAVKLIIQGKYWDSNIYSGVLYLFDRSNAFLTIDWDNLTRSISIKKDLQFPFKCLFNRSDMLYADELRDLLYCPPLKSAIWDLFESMAENQIVISKQNLTDSTSTSDNPFPFPHNDLRIYNRTVFVAASSGLYSSMCPHPATDGYNSLGSGVTKEWDAPLTSISASSYMLGLAAGDDGLHEKRVGHTRWYDAIDSKEQDRSIRQVSSKCALYCDWLYQSLFASNYESSEIDLFEIQKHRVPTQNPNKKYEMRTVRRKGENYPLESLIKSYSHATASGDKLFTITTDKVFAYNLDQRMKSSPPTLELQKSLKLKESTPRDIVSSTVSTFGLVIEYDESVRVIQSNNRIADFHGEPVRWRVFPRSKYYENQLHIIYDDRLEIYAFYHDWFVEQSSKSFGTPHRPKSRYSLR